MKEFIPIQPKCHSFKDEKWPLSEQFKNKEEIHIMVYLVEFYGWHE